MHEIRLLTFITRHTVELQGLRTMIVGGLCLTNAAWRVAGPALGVTLPPGVVWMALLLVGWHLDERVVAYYRTRMGSVSRLKPARRLIALIVVTLTYMALRAWELRADSQMSFSALFIAALHFHIGQVSGDIYRRHYLIGAGCWAALSLIPVQAFDAEDLATFWLAMIGLSLTLLGWRDHVLLMRWVLPSGDRTHVEDV